MKKIIAMLGLTLLVVSCAKDYTCTCVASYTETENGSSETETYPAETVTFKDVSKTVAEKNCMAREYEVTSGSSSSKSKYDCNLK